MNALKRFATSGRTKQLLPWLSAVVLLGGIGAVSGVFFSNTAKTDPGLSNTPAKVAKDSAKQIPLSNSARHVAARFIMTAVARKHLGQSYRLTYPTLRKGFTLEQWKTGSIPVVFYPVGKLSQANFKVDLSTPKQAQIELWLLPKKHAQQPPLQFLMGLRTFHRHWTVDLWQPLAGPPVHSP